MVVQGWYLVAGSIGTALKQLVITILEDSLYPVKLSPNKVYGVKFAAEITRRGSRATP